MTYEPTNPGLAPHRETPWWDTPGEAESEFFGSHDGSHHTDVQFRPIPDADEFGPDK